MAGADAPYDHLPFFYSDLFDLGYEAVGLVDSRLEDGRGLAGAVPQGRRHLRRGRQAARRAALERLGQARRRSRAHPRRRGCACRLARLARSRKPRRGTELVCEWVFRPLAHPLVAPASHACACRRPLSSSLPEPRASPAAVELGRGSLVVAALLVQLKTLLDNADGQLARLTGRTSAFGRYLDSEVDLLVNAALFAALGWTTGQPGARARRLPRADERPQPQLQRRAAVACGGRRAGSGRRPRDGGLRRIYGFVYAPAGPARRGARRAPAGAHEPDVRSPLLANLGMSTQLAAFGLLIALGHPLVFAWLALAQVAVIALAVLLGECAQQQEVA